MIDATKKEFVKRFGASEDMRVFFAPGRVNLIGEHTDYNGGHVFPCALTIGTYAAVAPRSDRQLRFYSMNFEAVGVIESSIDDLVPSKEAGWTNYLKGVMWAFKERGMKLGHGFDIVLNGNIPNGSGLSSSASIEVLMGYILKQVYGFEVSNVDIALLGQYSENNFNGMNCGIMDQFASAMGRKDCAIFLDTSTLKYEYAPIRLDGIRIVVTNSRIKHSLVDSAYNDRRNSCEEALNELKSVININTLGDLSIDEFEAHKSAIKNKDRIKKARHAVYENQRTIQAVQALKDSDIQLFGRLMNESHISLRDDYEVSCPEIDTLVSAAWTVEGCIGSRITGGGFGGCTVSLVKENCIDSFKQTLKESYQKEHGLEPEFYVVDIGDGPTELK